MLGLQCIVLKFFVFSVQCLVFSVKFPIFSVHVLPPVSASEVLARSAPSLTGTLLEGAVALVTVELVSPEHYTVQFTAYRVHC